MLAVDACKEFKEFKETDVWVCVWRFFNVFFLLGWIGVC